MSSQFSSGSDDPVRHYEDPRIFTPLEVDERFTLDALNSPWRGDIIDDMIGTQGPMQPAGEARFTLSWQGILDFLFPRPYFRVIPGKYRVAEQSSNARDKEIDFVAIYPQKTSTNMVPLNIPCFIFELKNPARFNEGDGAYSHRNETDLQIRQRFEHYRKGFFTLKANNALTAEASALKEIFAVSAYGLRKIALYHCALPDFLVSPPVHRQRDPNGAVIHEAAPKARWQFDCLTNGGYNMLVAVARRTHQNLMAAEIARNPIPNFFGDDGLVDLPSFNDHEPPSVSWTSYSPSHVHARRYDSPDYPDTPDTSGAYQGSRAIGQGLPPSALTRNRRRYITPNNPVAMSNNIHQDRAAGRRWEPSDASPTVPPKSDKGKAPSDKGKAPAEPRWAGYDAMLWESSSSHEPVDRQQWMEWAASAPDSP